MSQNLFSAFKLMGQGMFGIFVAMILISLIVYGITKISK